MNTEKHIIAATGHRPDKLGGYDDNVYWRAYNIAFRWFMAVEDKHPECISHVISGMAIGWDQAFAEAAIDCHIPFEAYVPFKGQESRWPQYAQDRYNKLLAKARYVRYISDPPFTARKMQIRNEAMVDNCTILLALWNGTGGGTANCIDYATKKGKTIINLWRHWEGQP